MKKMIMFFISVPSGIKILVHLRNDNGKSSNSHTNEKSFTNEGGFACRQGRILA
jgi:hypothetical protein